MKATLLMLCALLPLVTAGPVQRMIERSDSCAQSCTPSQKFRYEPGKTYTYDYTVRTNTAMDGASEDQAAITISGQADIEVIDQCDFVLKLKKMSVYESDNMQSPRSGEFRRTLEESPLRFSFQDGVVAELCPDRQEDGWALNVKRGVLSALQNSMDKLSEAQNVPETDVSGRCQAKYEVASRGWYSTTVKRSKDLLACTDRHGYSGSLQSARYHVPSDMQSLPLMKSEHECMQEVSSEGILKESTCTEKHLFRPFSSEGSGALTSVSQTLKYNSERSGIQSERNPIHARAEMPFDHGYGVSDSSQARARAESLLRTLCDITQNGIRPEVPSLFSQLVGVVQKMVKDDIWDIYQQLQRQAICSINNQRTTKFLFDALPMAGTSDAVSMMAQLMSEKEISDVELNLWLASLAFIPEPSAEMLSAVKPLLDEKKLKEKSMLPISALVHNYCKSRPSCSDEFAVEGIMASLEQNIGNNCYVTDSNIKTILMALKGLGNMGQARAVSVLTRCMRRRLPEEVRVEAALAFRRMPCHADMSQLMDVLEDKEEDAELRIAAYRQLMNCPSQSLIQRLQIVMESEPETSQVGAFMWTHLTNLMETSSPHKQDVRQMIQDVIVKKKFDISPLKFSRNYEKSVFLKMFNVGAEGESNVIFSAQSPLPRSINANLTFDLFGHSVNLLEIGGRMEGIEYLIETVLGPYSFFGRDASKDAKGKLEQLRGSMYARIFGNELAFSRFQGLDSSESGKTFNLLDFLIKLSKDGDYSFTQSLQLIDSSITVPTISGLPLTLAVNATATVDLQAGGKMDLRKVQASPRSINVDGQLRPSGAVHIEGMMSVDALVARSGLKVRGSLYSSTTLKGRVNLDRGRVLSVQWDMPDDRQDILDIRTQFFILRSDEEREQKMITDNRKELELCTGGALSRVTGLELCGQLQFPNASMKSSGPYFPLTGPSSISLVLHKRDSHTGYKLMGKRVENKKASIAQVSFDTPGSSVERAMSFDMSINYRKKEAEISFGSPWKKSALKGSLVKEDGLKSITGSLVVDDKDTYSFSSEIKVEQKPKDKTAMYTPVLEIRRPGAQTISLQGNAEVHVKLRTISADLTLSGVTSDPMQFQGSYMNTQSEKSSQLTLTHGKDQYQAQAGVKFDLRTGKKVSAQFTPTILISSPRGQLVSLTGDATYKQNEKLKAKLDLDIPGMLAKPVTVETSVTNKGGKRYTRYNVDLRFKSRPFTSKISGNILQRRGLSTARMSVVYAIQGVRKNLDIVSKLSDKSTEAYRKYTFSTNVDFKQNPDSNFQISLDLDHKAKRSAAELTLKLGKDLKERSKHFILSGSLVRQIASAVDVDIRYNFKAFAPMLDINSAITGSHSHTPKSLQSKIDVTFSKTKTVKADISLRDKSDEKMRLLADASLAFPGYSIQLDSTLTEKKPMQFEHSLDVKDKDGELASFTSTYKASKDKTREVSTAISIRNMKPIKVSGTTTLDLLNLEVNGRLVHGGAKYGLQVINKMPRGPRGKWVLEVSGPERKVALTANGGIQKNRLDFDLDLAWDKDRDNNAKISMKVDGKLKSTGSDMSTSGKLELTSPFPALPYLTASATLDSESKRYALDGKFSLGDKSETYSTSLSVAKPVSPRNLKVTWSGASPIRGYKRMEASLDHSIGYGSVTTTFKSSKGKDTFDVSLTGTNSGDTYRRDLKADVSVKASIASMRDVSVSFSHTDDGQEFKTEVSANDNGKRYSGALEMSHSRRDWQIQNSGKLQIVSPRGDSITKWSHQNSDSDVTSSLTSSWGRKEVNVNLKGKHELRGNTRTVNGDLKIRSPWKDAMMSIDHEMGDRHCKHAIKIVDGRKQIASTGLNYRLGDKKANLDLSLTSPFHHDISSKINGQFDEYPEIAHFEVKWSPRHTVTADANVIKADETGIEGNIRLTNSFAEPREITLKGSMAEEGEELVAKASADYGVRKSFGIDTKIRLKTLSLMRIKINTPFEDYRTVDTGYQFSGGSEDFSASADFALQPVLGKYDASFNLETADDISAKLRITTPHADMSYLQVTANSQDTPQGRQSRVELDFHRNQIYSVQSLYSLDAMPIVFSLYVHTPITGYDKFGLSLSHQATDSSILTHGEVVYLPEKTIDGTLDIRWDRDIQGTLVIKTPFERYEQSKVSVRHEGDLEDFSSQAQVDIASKTVTAVAKFKTGYTTSGSISVTSPWKKMEATFNKRGNIDNFKSDASLVYGDQKIEGSLIHKLNSRVLKTKASLSTPFTEDIESAVDYVSRSGVVDAEVSCKYGSKYSVRSESKLVTDQPVVSADTTLSYRLGGRMQVMKAAVSKKGEWDDVELTASVSSPFTEDVSLSVKNFYNLPSNVKSTVSGSYGAQYTIISDCEFTNSQPDISVTYSLQYTLDAPMKEVSVTVNKRGDFSNLQAEAKARTPLSGLESIGTEVTYSASAEAFSATGTVEYMTGRKITATVSNRGDLKNLEAQAKVQTPFSDFESVGAEITTKSSVDSFSAEGAVEYMTDRKISASVSKNGDMQDLKLEVKGKTPFSGFESIGADLAFSELSDGFSTDATVEYMTNRKIHQEVTLHRDGLRQMQIDASMTVPVPGYGTERTVVKIIHNSEYKKQSGSGEISSTMLGDHKITYKITGDLDHMIIEAGLTTDGKTTEGSVTRIPLTNGYKHGIEINNQGQKHEAAVEYELTSEKIWGKVSGATASSILSMQAGRSVNGRRAEINGKLSLNLPQFTKTAFVSLSKDGHLNDLTLDARGGYDAREATAHAEFKRNAHDVSGKLAVLTPVDGFRDIGASFTHSGDLDSFTSEGKVTYMDGKDIAGKITFYRYQWRRLEVTTELNTPFSGLQSAKAEYRHEGSSKSFSCFASVEREDDKISGDLRASISPKYAVSLTVKTPFEVLPSMVAEMSLESLAQTHSFESTLTLRSRYSVSGKLDMDSTPMTISGKLTSPFKSLRNVEISGSHEGQLDDFSSNIVFNSPQTDTIRGDIRLKYNSPLDVTASATVKSEIGGMEDLMVEVTNAESAQSKSSHVIVRWAPEQQLSADGTFTKTDYYYNKEIQTDLSVTTPFEPLRSASLHMQHSDNNDKASPKVELSINGESLVDVEAEYTRGNRPALSLTSRQPWPAQLTASTSTDGAATEAEVFVNWNRDRLDQSVRIQTRAMHVQDSSETNIDYSIKMIHPSRTVSSGVSLLVQQDQMTSEGHVAWDLRDNSRISYKVELKDNSRHSRKDYDASAQLQFPGRTMEASGGISAYRQTSSLEGSFSWDTQRDPTKQVGFTAKITSGDKSKADVTFRLPAIGKDVRIESEMAVNEGRVLWDGKTALSYSPDSRKTITLSSSLKDVSDSYFNEGKNYSLSLAISHPYTDVDVSLTSHLGAIGDRYSTAIDLQYLTARRQKKNLALRGEIDRLRRHLDLQLVSPVTKMAVQGQVKSTDPYVLTLTNTVNEQPALSSQIQINRQARLVLLETNYDTDYPENKLVLKMNYIDDSAVQAELYRDQPRQKVTESLVSARLNTPRLLHTRLTWRPDMLTDLQTFARRKTEEMASSAKTGLVDAVDAVGEELSAKYKAIAEEISSELRPLVDLLEGELPRLGQHLDQVRVSIKRMYKRNHFYLQDMGQSVEESIKSLKVKLYEMSREYQESYTALLSAMQRWLDDLRHFPVQQKYREEVAELLVGAEALMEKVLIRLNNGIAQIDDNLIRMRDSAGRTWEGMKNHPHVQRIGKRVQLLGSDYRWLMSHVGERVRQFQVPEGYSSAIYDAREAINSRLSNVMENKEVRRIQSAANEVYQQGLWAYKYWQVEENMPKNLEILVQLVSEIVQQQLQFLTEKVDFLRKSKVTVYDPERGEIQADIALPVPLKSLTEMPDIDSCFQQAKDTISDYLPSKDTVVDFYNKYAPNYLWTSNETKQATDDILDEFKTYTPKRLRMRSKGKGPAAYPE